MGFTRNEWLSQRFERLVDRVRKSAPEEIHFDVLIIGSGYGGAVAASVFAGRTLSDGKKVRVGVLERGSEYLPGSFPKDLAELPRHIRRSGSRQGLFDVRTSPEMITVVANGVGGGSLINAGVMQRPKRAVFRTGWPRNLSDFESLSAFYDEAQIQLGAGTEEKPNTIERSSRDTPEKFRALKAMAAGSCFRPAAITVSLEGGPNEANVNLNKCIRCGDCAMGCNHGAKDSLDTNLLVVARRAGAEIFSGATVLSVEEHGERSCYVVRCVFTDAKLRERDAILSGPGERTVAIRAGRVIIAAGTLGSNEIIKRSHDRGLDVSSERVGAGCSANGDALIVDYDTAARVNTVASEDTKPSERKIGPTITGIIDLRKEKGLLIEDSSVPAALRVAFTQVFTTANTLHDLEKIDWSTHLAGLSPNDSYSASKDAIGRTAVFAVMGDDGANGWIDFSEGEDPDDDSFAKMRWRGDSAGKLYETQLDELSRLARNTGGRILPNPAWRLLPKNLTWLARNQSGLGVTVHPLGGLCMADGPETGVVDDLGRIYRGTNGDVHEGLVVMDGSIVPTALGTNPALTIAALAFRSAKTLAKVWGFVLAETPCPKKPVVRPMIRGPDATDRKKPDAGTEVEVIERLIGPIRFRPDGQVAARDCIMELTLRSVSTPVSELFSENGEPARLRISTDRSNPQIRSRIRIFDREMWEALDRTFDSPALREAKLDALAEFAAPVSGDLKILWRGHSRAIGRILRSGWAWLLNRGMRDFYQLLVDREDSAAIGLLKPGNLKSMLGLASRAGEVRHLIYDLRIEMPDRDDWPIKLAGQKIRGTKTFTYSRCGNPWRQLMEVSLDEFPGIDRSGPRRLTLDLTYLTWIGVPLFRISRETDGVGAITDLLGFFGYFLRLLIGVHAWSFRAPDSARKTDGTDVDFSPPDPLQVADKEPVPAEISCIDIANEVPDLGEKATTGKVRITRYPQKEQTKLPPVVMLHGYTAGGTTFAHRSVEDNLASHLWKCGRDVWIADLRTSPYFKDTTAKLAWSFEQIGKADVRLVLQEAAASTKCGKVDVVAHCMGAVALTHALLEPEVRPAGSGAKSTAELIRRIVLSQVGPLVVFSPSNIFRAYAIRYFLDFLPKDFQYSYRPEDPTPLDDLLDRALSTLPYPVEEFRIENPILPWKRVAWTRSRHRMDALFGRVFNAADMDPATLACIDEFFGPMSPWTAASTQHFVRNAVVTDCRGRNQSVSRRLLATNWQYATLSLHGAENGLADVATASRLREIMNDSRRQFLEPSVFEGIGHQDLLIGKKRKEAFGHIAAFLDADFEDDTKRIPRDEPAVFPPWIGPVITLGNANQLEARVAATPEVREPLCIVMLRVRNASDRLFPPEDRKAEWELPDVLDQMVLYFRGQPGGRAATMSNETPVPPAEADPPYDQRWTKFIVPRSTGTIDPADEVHGNATAVLVAYDEASDLVQRVIGPSYLRLEIQGDKRVPVTFNAGEPERPGNEALEITFGTFEKIGAALLRVLQAQGERTERPTPSWELRSTKGIVPGPEPEYGSVKKRELIFRDEREEKVLDSNADASLNLRHAIIPDQNPPERNKTEFALGSCQYPAGFLDGPVAEASYRKIFERSESGSTRMLLLVGDQVYVDPTAGLYDPTNRDDAYRLPYEAWLRQEAVRDTLRRIPSFMLLDDHEIADNWEEPDDSELRDEGLAAFRKYQRGLTEDLEAFNFDGFPFFLLDTRSNRKERPVGKKPGQICDLHAIDRLKAWTTSSATTGPKFVATPSIFLPRHRAATLQDPRIPVDTLAALASDGWDGYPETMHDILRWIAEQRISNLVFLSGDEHRSVAATATIHNECGEQVARFHSIHTSALWSPYPFANAVKQDFIGCDCFPIKSATHEYTCRVSTYFPDPVPGPTFLSVARKGNGGTLTCEFSSGETRCFPL